MGSQFKADRATVSMSFDRHFSASSQLTGSKSRPLAESTPWCAHGAGRCFPSEGKSCRSKDTPFQSVSHSHNRNDQGQLGTGDDIARHTPSPLTSFGFATTVSCGQYHSVALTAEGRLFAWGSNQHGQLGLDSPGSPPAGTQRVLAPHGIGPPGVRFVDVRAGGFHTVALADDGRLYAFGRNDDGQLGLGDLLARGAPTPVPAAGVAFASVAACLRHTLVR